MITYPPPTSVTRIITTRIINLKVALVVKKFNLFYELLDVPISGVASDRVVPAAGRLVKQFIFLKPSILSIPKLFKGCRY